MNTSFFKKALPHIIAIGIFLVVALIYCQPALEGKVLNNTDNQGWKGMAQQSFEFKEKHGHFPYWTNSMFSGMPGYQIAFETPNKISIGILHNYVFTLGLPKPINYFFLACLMAYFLLIVLKINPWIAVMGGLAYAYSTYDPILVAVGHDTKMICIGYAPAVIAGLMLILQRRYILGTVSMALFTAMILWQNHIQVTYYTAITALCICIAFFIHSLMNKELKHAMISGSLALLAGAVALGVNTINIWPMNEYTRETMRGGRSELTDTTTAKNKTVGGLDKDYAFFYGSYGINESFTFMVPYMYGGGNTANTFQSGKSSFAEKLTEVGVPEESALQMANGYAYWGNQPAHGGPTYFGAIICFLVIAAMVYLKGWLKWGLVATTLFCIILAWGKNLQGINYFLFDHLPLYKKFRAPSIALVVPQMSFVVLACLCLQQLMFGGMNKEEVWKKFKLSVTITGVILLLLTFMYFSFDYRGPNDAAIKENFANQMLQGSKAQQPTPQMQQQAQEFATGLMKGLQADRQGLFGKDLLRSIFLIALAITVIGLLLKDKLKPNLALAALVLLSSFDILAVGRRHLNNEKFIEPTESEAAFTATAANLKIMSDPDKNIRVFDQASGDPFQSSVASYHHNSIGGYSPVKLALYQDIISRQLSKGNMNVYNMLNTKYFIVQNPANGQPEARLNPDALGNAWFVKGFAVAKNADQEMDILSTMNTRDSAVIDTRFLAAAGAQPVYDSNAKIQLLENVNDKLLYKTSASRNQFAVLSEVYYPFGWDAYLDGNKVDYIRVNYVLRGLPIPAGNHTLEFRFEPRSVILGDKITMWLSILLYLMLAVGLFLEFRKKTAA